MSIPRMTKEELKERLDSGDPSRVPVVVDARLKYPYEHSTVRLPKAVRVAPTDPDLASLPRDRDIVLYDSDPEEIVSARLAAQLIRQGYRAWALQGGIVDWLGAKFEIEAKEAPQMAPPRPGSLKG